VKAIYLRLLVFFLIFREVIAALIVIAGLEFANALFLQTGWMDPKPAFSYLRHAVPIGGICSVFGFYRLFKTVSDYKKARDKNG